MDKCCLLTGSTGLLGRHLLHDLTVADVPLAVLVRPGKLQPARDRIDAIMAPWEAQKGRLLQRPFVLEGDLRMPDLGLDERARRWVANHCDSVLHSAASMAFVADEKEGEPQRTNVEGVKHLLAFCRQAGIRRFHHVSTAYVCGLREGRVLESELDMGQQLGNVYEQSKLAAEKLLRGAECFDSLTVYRPASIVGHSVTGATTNYHGFYLPLQLAYAFSVAVPPEVMDARFSALLGLTGREGKNLAPVDWLSAAITYLFTHGEHHGRTYHLTNPRPVTVRLIQHVIQEAIHRYSKRPTAERISPKELAGYERLFYSQMLVYRSHWRDDPQFDRTNTDAALGHLACPEMDEELLMRVARYAIEANFGERLHEPVVRTYDVGQHMAPWVEASDDRLGPSGGEVIGLEVTGAGGGQWRLMLDDGAVIGAEMGMADGEAAVCHLNAETFAGLVGGRLNAGDAIVRGRIVVEGPSVAFDRAVRALNQVATAINQPRPTPLVAP